MYVYRVDIGKCILHSIDYVPKLNTVLALKYVGMSELVTKFMLISCVSVLDVKLWLLLSIQENFPSYPELLRLAVSLGRRMQEPLHEFTSLFMSHEEEIYSLRMHPLQVNCCLKLSAVMGKWYVLWSSNFVNLYLFLSLILLLRIVCLVINLEML